MNELANMNDRRMTVKKVAGAMGLSQDKVYRSARELFPGAFTAGKTAYLNEAQITALKYNLRKTAEVMVMPKTSLEKALLIKQAMQLQQEMVEELQAENAGLKAKIETDRPKVEFFDAVAESGDCIDMREVAAVLNLPGWGRNKIFSLLRERGVLDGRNLPYREYQDRGYFRVIEQKWTTSEGETRVSLKTLACQRGVDFIRRLAAKEAA